MSHLAGQRTHGRGREVRDETDRIESIGSSAETAHLRCLLPDWQRQAGHYRCSLPSCLESWVRFYALFSGVSERTGRWHIIEFSDDARADMATSMECTLGRPRREADGLWCQQLARPSLHLTEKRHLNQYLRISILMFVKLSVYLLFELYKTRQCLCSTWTHINLSQILYNKVF